MASIFTFDPEPPSVSSPWLAVGNGRPPRLSSEAPSELHSTGAIPIPSLLPSLNPAENFHLEAEPQEGPTEYKLHLLLRPRRSLSSTSTGRHVSGSQHSKCPSPAPRSMPDTSLASPSPIASFSSTRQHRLEQLTTQLLWRLQQSSPYHSSSAHNLILPSLPEAKSRLQPPERPAKLLPGLEESKGALYEIGVSDDGVLVGLTMDEMNESLTNLRAMAASLGCSTEILRMVCVGSCEWLERPSEDDNAEATVQSGKLYVAEAYVKPELRGHPVNVRSSVQDSAPNPDHENVHDLEHDNPVGVSERHDGQVRVSLTGATTCGKSSLLGTLSTSTLDNSRGKSRLSLLKHRHEIASGMTSSVSQELVGYQDEGHGHTRVINYATENVSSWTDIHSASESGRLALLSDSAGHPRYRRTTVRGLVGCAPHWILLCIAANEDPHSNASVSVSTSEASEPTFLGANAHISIAHLDLCLKLQTPLAVIVTKFDLATKSGFRLILSTLLTRLKAAGRKPEIISNDSKAVTEDDLHTVSAETAAEVSQLSKTLAMNPLGIVPIIFTSSVKGIGIPKLHALLRHLPIPVVGNQSDGRYAQDAPATLFHVDDIFNLPLNKMHGTESLSTTSDSTVGSIISGHAAYGTVSIGDILQLGPFSEAGAGTGPSTTTTSSNDTPNAEPSSSVDLTSGFLTPRSFTDALVKVTSSPKLKSVPTEREWRRVKVVSARNLRMPVHSIQTDQVGTIGVQPLSSGIEVGDADSAINPLPLLPIRKGMVLASETPEIPRSAHTFTASFQVDEASSIIVGTVVVVYSASVRTTAKVVAVALESQGSSNSNSESRARPDSQSRRAPRGFSSSPSRGDTPAVSTAEPPALESEDYAFGFEFDDEHSHNDEPPQDDRDSGNDGDGDSSADESANETILVTFRLVTHREYLVTGAKVLVMPGGGPGLLHNHQHGHGSHGSSGSGGGGAERERGVKGIGGLEGFVGKIVRTFG